MEKSNNKKLLLITALMAFAFLTLTLFAQDKKDDLKSKMKQLKGKVEKITVKIDGKDVVFEGKDAEKLAKALKFFAKTPNMMWLSDDDEDFDLGDGNVMMYKFNTDKFDWKDKDGGNKKIKIEVKEGEKKVTVTTTDEDGKEETKVYKGEDAEKYLKENEREGKLKVFIDGDDDSSGNVIYFRSNGDCNCCCGKRIHFRGRHGKGVKKIIIEKNEKDDK